MHQIYAAIALDIALDRRNEAANWRLARTATARQPESAARNGVRTLAGRIIGSFRQQRSATVRRQHLARS